VPDVETGVGLELPTHRLMRKDVGKRMKKVWRPSPYCGGSYGRWRDHSGGLPWSHRAFCVLYFVFSEVICWLVRGPINKMDGLCVGRGRDGQTLFHLEVNSLGKMISTGITM
jgi:hypothetical protein